ncbi:MAG: SUMF1/EgtB/PvdO family nonheme iron enzyme [Okeania sp. SIO3I5]|uniref:SUMF1/EgtB/PvdO family nonheme iron enzyme n=1 Tax=Okeania sp. SIO3I5 TaxID=2607805 RepID=UPI0013BCFF60|nr:SUMF1/EgtB/PvdO family nonheme iron enzyme [Okeania sp. SIO3I5]NEQ40695.1 SUMF1/EgtB/PvdO family nonheme iron enzyme [Okeania sp. SIO3I5]
MINSDKLIESIVSITSTLDKRANVIGTGFAFYRERNYTYLLTCAHVVEDMGDKESVLVNGISAEVVAMGDTQGFDLAVLRVEGLNNPLLKLINLSETESRKFQVAGQYLYGQGRRRTLEIIGGFLGKKSFITQENERVIAWGLFIDSGDRLRPGYSGAPVIDLETGDVLGIATNMEKDGTEGVAISVEALSKIWLEIPPAISQQLKPLTHPVSQQPKFFTENLGEGTNLEMVYIPGGTFLMGSPENEEGRDEEESPQHQVTLQPFYMSKYPITQNQYQAIMGENPSYFQGKKRPVESVSWHDATEFCQQLSQKTGNNYRLPSESQWEYACRAGTTTPFYFGETITSELANYNGNYNYGNSPKSQYRQETTDVGSFPPNDFDLYDMHGNVWEWCADDWHKNYEGAPTDGSAWLENDEKEHYPLLRGGSWYVDPYSCRSAYRFNNFKRHLRNVNIGFRIVCDEVSDVKPDDSGTKLGFLKGNRDV